MFIRGLSCRRITFSKYHNETAVSAGVDESFCDLQRASCTDASGVETAHSTEALCEYEPTGNSWDASAAAGAECLDASGSVLASQPADEDTCVRQASGRSWDGLGTTNAPVLLSQDQSTAACTKTGRVWTNMTQRDDSNDVLSNESVRLCRYHEDQPAAAGDLHLRTDGERKRSF